MDEPLSARSDFLVQILDAVPSMLLVVDEDVAIEYLNTAARKSFGDSKPVLRRRGGDVLGCLQAQASSEGCGHGPACTRCVIRGSVREAFAGNPVRRKPEHMELVVEGAPPKEVHLLVSTSPLTLGGRRLVLLQLEDISELVALRSIIPICMYCKKVRDDKEYWDTVERFLATRLDVSFSHSICPACLKEHYPEHQDLL